MNISWANRGLSRFFFVCWRILNYKNSYQLIVWGADQMGRRLSKQLEREGAPLQAFVDIDPGKIGRQRRGCPIVSPDELRQWLEKAQNPVVPAAVCSHGARELIRERLIGTEGA